jgi:hypothetical protein
MSAASRKILGLGLSRTATTSLARALRILGYRSLHFPPFAFRYTHLGALMGLRQLRLVRGVYERYDALIDIPVIPFYKELDLAHPGSRFILTVREKESWLESCRTFGRFQPDLRLPLRGQELRMLVYGTVHFDRGRFSEAYDRHHRDVHDYFRERPDDLLVLNICAGEGWERLCPFLGHDVPGVPFPWVNRRPGPRDPLG